MSTPELSVEQSIALECQQRRQANLEYFSKTVPEIAQAFGDFKMKTLRVNINSDGIDLIDDGKLRYNNSARKKAMEDIVQLSGEIVRPRVDMGTYFDDEGVFYPRFAFQRLRKLVNTSGLKEADFKHYHLGSKLPCVVALGAGLGYQLEELTSRFDVQHLIVVEPDPEVFAASLYAADWAKICQDNMNVTGRSVLFLIGHQDDDATYRSCWNTLLGYFPLYPINTYYLRHREADWAVQLCRRLRHDATAAMNALGNFDDELNQLVFALHNLHLNRPVIAPKAPAVHDIPVCIVGAGPSLDERFEELEALRDKVFVISCGTALKGLHSRGMVPDLHVEVESDKLMLDVLEGVGDSGFVKQLTVLTAAQVSPPVLDRFKQAYIYFKTEGVVAELFGEQVGGVAMVAPTVTNAAAGLAFALGFKQMFLFGCDYGFKDKSRHHASGTIYQTDELSYMWDDFHSEGDFVRVPGVDGQELFANGVFFLARKRMDHAGWLFAKHGVEMRNCSNGAYMKNVPWISTADFREHLAQKPALHEREQQLQGILERVHVPRPALAGADELAAGISAMAQGLARLLPETISGRDELTDICYRFNQTLQQFQGAKVSAVRLIGGTLKHFNFVMYSHGYALEGEAEVVALYRSWRKQLLDFMRDAARHTQRVLKQRPWGDLSDPWLALSLVQNEMEAIDGRRKKNQKTATAQ